MNDIKLGWNFFIETEYDSCSLGRWSGYDLHIYGLNDTIREKEEQLKAIERQDIVKDRAINNTTLFMVNKTNKISQESLLFSGWKR
jgi:hypothetical protein